MPLENVVTVLKKHLSTEDKELSGILGQVLRFLNQSDDGFDAQPLIKALIYLGGLTVNTKPYFGNPEAMSFRKYLKGKGLETVQDNALLDEIGKDQANFRVDKSYSLSPEARKILREVYAAIFTEYKKVAEQVWTYTYPQGSFREWQSAVINSAAYDAKSDFSRHGYFINGSTENVEQGIAQLVASADKYSAEEKAKIITWLGEKGGQQLTGDLWIQMFGDKRQFSEQILEMGVTQERANWMVEDGEVVLTFDAKCASLTLDYKAMVAGVAGLANENFPEDSFEEGIQKYQRLRDDKVPFPDYLMRMKGKITLGVDDKGNIFPEVTECKIESRRSELQSPARLYVERDLHQNNSPRRD